MILYRSTLEKEQKQIIPKRVTRHFSLFSHLQFVEMIFDFIKHNLIRKLKKYLSPY